MSFEKEFNVESNVTALTYDQIQVRVFEDTYATICFVIEITTNNFGKSTISKVGQLMNLHKINGQWMIYTLQATPIFEEIEEIEAYPFKFADNILEKYHQQEMIAKNVQLESIGIYRINFTKNICEEAVLKSDLLVPCLPGDNYEKKLFESARSYLNEEDQFHFISIFSIGNVLHAYAEGKTELFIEYQLVNDDRHLWMKFMVRIYTDQNDQNIKGYFYVININDAKVKELELTSKIELDPLTGLFNRVATQTRIEALLKTISPNCLGAFFMIDLDHFKYVNDTFGHKTGDDIICQTAVCMRTISRKHDIAGRLGGDEFCLYFQGELSKESISEKATQLCEKIRHIAIKEKVMTSCSIGIVICDNNQLRFDEIYRLADQALYKQKETGRDGFLIHQ